VDLEATLQEERVKLETGDILLIRTGWVGWYESLDMDARARLAVPVYPDTPGLTRDEHTAEWLWDHHVAAVAADNIAVEALPVDNAHAGGMLHYRLIPLLGLAVGELFVLDPLARDCASDGVYEGMLVSAPLNKVGGSGSPANALAIK